MSVRFETSVDFSSFRVLVAEGDEALRRELADRVRALGASCDGVADGEAALAALETGTYSFFLVDVELPRLNGAAVTRRFRSSGLPAASRMPILGMSSSADDRVLDGCLEAGMDALTCKPVLAETLFSYFRLLLRDDCFDFTYALRLRQRSDRSALLDTLINNMPITLFAKDGETGRYRTCNQMFADFASVNSPADVIGKTDADLFGANVADGFVSDDRRAMASGDKLDFMERVTNPKGRSYYLHTIKTGFVASDGRRCLLGLSVDQTSEAEKEQHITALNARLERSYAMAKFRADALALLARGGEPEKVMEFFADGLLELSGCDQVVFADLEGKILVWSRDDGRATVWQDPNCAGCQLRNPRSEVYANGLLESSDPETAEKRGLVSAGCPIKSFMARRIYRRSELDGLLAIRYLKERHDFSDESRDMFELVSELLGVVRERSHDEHERRRQLKLFEQERDRAVAAEKAKSYFFSTVSHDIRTPLNAIVGFAQMLKLGLADPTERANAIDAMLASSRTLQQLINDVLDLSKLEAGRMEIVPEPTDCGTVVVSVVDAFRPVVGDRPVELVADVKPMPTLLVDPQRLRQILFNIVGNAVKFTERGEVRVSADYADGVLRLTVSDTGCGISEEDLRKIAEPYVQVGERGRNGGTGLGLAIVRQLVSRMHGKVKVGSRLGEGTSFRVELSAVRPATGAELQRPSSTQRIRSLVSGSDKVARRRILVVDDSSVNIAVLRGMLKVLGHTDVATASNGREALALFGRSTFDLVLTDMWMPEMDGEVLIRELRARGARLPVYAVTADVEVQKNYEELGFTGILLKPVTLEALKDIVGAAAQKGNP